MTNEPKTKNPQHYIDHEEFTLEMDLYSKACAAARRSETDKPRITQSIGIKFMKIAENLGHLHNFRGYTYLDEMIGDAIENMIRYAHNFDKSRVGKTGAFSYFTQFAYWAFLRRIAKEDKQYRTKVKWVQSFALLDLMPDDRQDHDAQANFENKFVDYLYEYYDAEHKKEEKPKKKRKTPVRKKTSLETKIEKQVDVAA